MPYIKEQVKALDYEALTKDEFIQKTSNFYKYQTGVGTNVLIMTVISFIVGLFISGQTFYPYCRRIIRRVSPTTCRFLSQITSITRRG